MIKMKEIYYNVHSEREDGDLCASLIRSFNGRGAKQKAIAYAKSLSESAHAYVDRVVQRVVDSEFGVEWEYECVWSYDWE